MYDLYDHITAEPFAPRPTLITNFLCYLTNLERRPPSQYNGRYLCLPSMGFEELQAGLEATSLVKKAYHDMSRAARLFSHLFCFLFPSVNFKRQLSCRRLYPIVLVWA